MSSTRVHLMRMQHKVCNNIYFYRNNESADLYMLTYFRHEQVNYLTMSYLRCRKFLITFAFFIEISFLKLDGSCVKIVNSQYAERIMCVFKYICPFQFFCCFFLFFFLPTIISSFSLNSKIIKRNFILLDTSSVIRVRIKMSELSATNWTVKI